MTVCLCQSYIYAWSYDLAIAKEVQGKALYDIFRKLFRY